MGYESRVTGRITITPPVPIRVVKDSPALNRAADVRYEVDTTSEEVADGTLIKEHVVAIVAANTDWCKAYDLEQHLRDTVAEVHGYESVCSGALIRTGAEPGDVERYRIADGRVVVEKAELRWPDGTVVDL